MTSFIASSFINRTCYLNCGLVSSLDPLLSYSHSTACVLLLHPPLLCLHSRDETMGTLRMTSRLSVTLNIFLVPPVSCHWRHEQESWQQARVDTVRESGTKKGNLCPSESATLMLWGQKHVQKTLCVQQRKLMMSEKLPVQEAQAYLFRG